MPSSSRSEPSRQSLVSAAGRVISDKGLQGLRVREVAATAGLSPAAVLYHYPDNSDLLIAVHRLAVRRYLEARHGAQDGVADARDRLIGVARAGIPPFADTDTIHLLFEMHGLARRSQRHSELMTELWEQEAGLYAEIVEAGARQGHFSPRRPSSETAVALLALEDGLALHLTSHNAALDAAGALSVLVGAAATELKCPSLIDELAGAAG